MTNVYLQIQILYEISMAIDYSLDYKSMLKKALTAYLRKLKCTSGCIYQFNISDTNIKFENAISLPKMLNINKSYKIINDFLKNYETAPGNSDLNECLPIVGTTDEEVYYSIMKLSDFGIIALTKSEEKFDLDIIKSLDHLNNKLGNAGMSCLQALNIHEKESNFRMFFESIADLIFIMDFSGTILFANKSSLQNLNFTGENLINENISDLFYSNDGINISEILRKVINLKIINIEHSLKTFLNSEVPVQSNLWKGQWNGTECIYMVSKNLSDEKAALVKFEKLFSNNPALMSVNLVPDGEFIEVNNAFLETLGFDKSDVIGKTPKELRMIAEANQEDVIKSEILSKGRLDKYEVTLRKKDGILLNGLFSGEIIKEKNKEYFLTVIVDNTAQKMAETKLLNMNKELEFKVRDRTMLLEEVMTELKDILDEKDKIFLELEESENKYKVLINNISSALLLLHDDYFEILNTNFYDIFGLERSNISIFMDNFLQLFPDQFRGVVETNIHEIEKIQNIKSNFEVLGLRKDGQECELEINMMSLKISENSGILVMLTDISERKLMESQLAHALKMESIGTLAAGIAHEINTPLQYIGNNTNFLRDSFSEIKDYLNSINELESDNSDEVNILNFANLQELRKEKDIDFLLGEIPVAINESQEGIDIVSKIVQAMKAFSHPGQKKMEYSSINQGLEATVNISKNEWKYCSDIDLDIAADLPDVFCNISSLNQVFLNLIINARDAIIEKFPTGAEKSGKIKISTCRNGDFIEIIVSDNGQGIEEKNKRRIFDQFFTTKQVGKGTGQGLSLAYNIIVKNHGGGIDFNSEVGIGTNFIIKIPIHSSKN